MGCSSACERIICGWFALLLNLTPPHPQTQNLCLQLTVPAQSARRGLPLGDSMFLPFLFLPLIFLWCVVSHLRKKDARGIRTNKKRSMRSMSGCTVFPSNIPSALQGPLQCCYFPGRLRFSLELSENWREKNEEEEASLQKMMYRQVFKLPQKDKSYARLDIMLVSHVRLCAGTGTYARGGLFTHIIEPRSRNRLQHRRSKPRKQGELNTVPHKKEAQSFKMHLLNSSYVV